MVIKKSVLCSIVVITIMIPNASAIGEDYQIASTTNKKLDVMFFTIPEDPQPYDETKLKVEFLKPSTRTIQEHIDYKVTIEKEVSKIFETPLVHTSTGSVTIPFNFKENGLYEVYVNVEGILFSPIPKERAIFSVQVGQEQIGHEYVPIKETVIPPWIKNSAGWWAQGQIDDSDFISGIEYLITHGIMNIPKTNSEQASDGKIPNWIKNNAGWWSEDKIDDSDFVSGIQYLITNGIMSV